MTIRARGPDRIGHKARPTRRARSTKLWFLALAVLLALASNGRADEAPRRILAFGNSLTAGYGLSAAESFPTQLEKALRAKGHHVRVINAGVSGDTTAGGNARLAWTLSEKPDAAILELGANDGLRGLDPAETEKNLRAMIGTFRRSGTPVLLAGMKAPPNYGKDYAERFAALFPRVAAETGALLYPFFLDGVAGNPALNQADGIHPTAAGVAVIVERILPSVEALLATIPRSAGDTHVGTAPPNPN